MTYLRRMSGYGGRVVRALTGNSEVKRSVVNVEIAAQGDLNFFYDADEQSVWGFETTPGTRFAPFMDPWWTVKSGESSDRVGEGREGTCGLRRQRRGQARAGVPFQGKSCAIGSPQSTRAGRPSPAIGRARAIDSCRRAGNSKTLVQRCTTLRRARDRP